MRKISKRTKKEVEVRTLYGAHRCVLEPDKEGFVVNVPGLRGVATWGKSISHARAMAREAIELCIECTAEKR
ncbi:MAG: type II toxin-antitoxin system HicB family antitoxin [Nanoarchaeota archaeon]|nr:type II toxin-antitoxin system HicB family antitoxin [Nanoarchaeota archaeon]